MEDRKAKRLESERTKLISARKIAAINVFRQYKISSLPFTAVMPEPLDFLEFPEVKAILNQPSGNELSQEDLEHLVTRLPAMIHDWRAKINQQLVDHLEQEKKAYDCIEMFLGRLPVL